jgi:hypothetical protein
MDAPAKTSLLQRVIDAWKVEGSAAGDSELDAADLGTAYGLDCSFAERIDVPGDLDEH